MPRKAPPVLDHSMVDGVDDRDLLSERARRGSTARSGDMQGVGAPEVCLWPWGCACGWLRCPRGDSKRVGRPCNARAVVGL